ncbi:translation initiation factor IF-2-like isoform X5 [Gallus gallus]|uniref:translation initiation factor IF-2-like isoform X5 n=1 Tax=Gallus gallus TaxID=9031 RepID=UPI001AE62589|nr:translation initiation factor IF-2-like isoform X5 [Gallus gallus]
MDSLRSPAPPPPPPPPALPSPPAAVRGERLRALHWEPLSAARVRGRRSVWAPRTPPPALDLPRLRLLFREPRGASPGQRPPPVAALLEPKRSIALGVLLKQLKRPVRQIVRDIEEGVGAPYGAELLLELSRLLPGAVELRAAPGADGAAGGVLPATQRAPRLHPNPRRRRGGGGAVRGAARGSASRPERGEPPERGRLRGQRRRVSPGLAAEAARHQGQRAGRGPAALRGHGGGTDRPTPVGLPEQTAARGPGLADRRGGGGGGAAAAVGARGGGAGCGSGAVRGAAAVRAGGGGGAARGAGGEGTDVRSRGGSARLLLRGGGAGRAAGAVCGAARLRGPLPERRAGEPRPGAVPAPAAAARAAAGQAALRRHVFVAGRGARRIRPTPPQRSGAAPAEYGPGAARAAGRPRIPAARDVPLRSASLRPPAPLPPRRAVLSMGVPPRSPRAVGRPRAARLFAAPGGRGGARSPPELRAGGFYPPLCFCVTIINALDLLRAAGRTVREAKCGMRCEGCGMRRAGCGIPGR